MSEQDAYGRWVTVSGQALDCARSPAMLEVIGAASAAMAELHDEIARLERDKAKVPHPSQDFPWQPARDSRPERVRRYEDRPGPLRGFRGVTAHLDPVTPPPGTPPGADYQAVYRLACTAALYAGIAEEALNLLGTLDRTPGNRVLVLQRAAELRTRLDGLDARNLGT
jgi:hypothetical protein